MIVPRRRPPAQREQPELVHQTLDALGFLEVEIFRYAEYFRSGHGQRLFVRNVTDEHRDFGEPANWAARQRRSPATIFSVSAPGMVHGTHENRLHHPWDLIDAASSVSEVSSTRVRGLSNFQAAVAHRQNTLFIGVFRRYVAELPSPRPRAPS